MRDVRVVQRGERLRFAREPGQAIGVVRKRIRQHLQRDIAIELGVAGAPHLAHSAFADLSRDFVDAEAGTGSEGHVLWIIRAGWRPRAPVGRLGAGHNSILKQAALKD